MRGKMYLTIMGLGVCFIGITFYISRKYKNNENPPKEYEKEIIGFQNFLLYLKEIFSDIGIKWNENLNIYSAFLQGKQDFLKQIYQVVMDDTLSITEKKEKIINIYKNPVKNPKLYKLQLDKKYNILSEDTTTILAIRDFLKDYDISKEKISENFIDAIKELIIKLYEDGIKSGSLSIKNSIEFLVSADKEDDTLKYLNEIKKLSQTNN